VLDVKGKHVARQLLTDFGVEKVGDVTENKRRDFLAAVERVMK